MRKVKLNQVIRRVLEWVQRPAGKSVNEDLWEAEFPSCREGSGKPTRV